MKSRPRYLQGKSVGAGMHTTCDKLNGWAASL